MIVGTAGHIDHGKTSLVRALTGVDTDRLKEEKARGITIDLGFAYLPTPDGTVLGFVDVPGHEKFVHNMLAGASGIDFVLLVVAADDGIMPQTQEHLAIVDLLGVARGMVAITKADLVSPDRCEEVIQDARRVIATTGLSAADIIPVSSVTCEGLRTVRERLFAAAQAFKRQGLDGRFRLAVDRCFTLAGTGTVVTGTVLSGAVSVGDHVSVSPTGLSARVRSIHAQNRATDHGQVGERCALNLAGDGISKDAIARGNVVLDPVLHAPADRIDATLRALASESKVIGQWMPVRFHHASVEVGARIALLDDPIAPGQQGRVQLVLDRPIAAAVGDRFVLRDTSAQRTIGGGRLIDLHAPARKRRTPERRALLDAHAVEDHGQAIAALLALGHVELTRFSRDRGLSASTVERIVKDLGLVCFAVGDQTIALSPADWLQVKRAVTATLQTYHTENPDLAGIGLERLRLEVARRIPAPAFRAMLQSLARSGDISLDGAWVRLRSHEVRLAAEDEKLWQMIRPLIGVSERFRPPRVRDIGGVLNVPEMRVRRLFKLLSRMGKTDEIAHDHFFLRSTVTEMVAIAVDLVETTPGGQFTAGQFRDRLDNGRKVAIQILEFFDRHGVTLRRGDLRRTNKHRLDLFGASVDERTTPVQAGQGRESSPVGRSDFKSVKGREPVFGGFDSHSLPPPSRSVR